MKAIRTDIGFNLIAEDEKDYEYFITIYCKKIISNGCGDKDGERILQFVTDDEMLKPYMDGKHALLPHRSK